MTARLISVLLTVLLAGPVTARDVADLYRGQAEVNDRSPAELKRGASLALGEVLVKLTGTLDSATALADSGLVKRAANLMLQYAYQPGEGGSGLRLQAEFDESALLAELESRQVAVWGKERPDTLIWLIIDAGAQRQLVGGDEPGVVGEAVQQRAARRGIPVLLPLMDIDESRYLIPAGDFAGISTTALALSSRYRTAATLVGHLQDSGAGIWEAHWQLQVDESSQRWEESGDILELMLEAAVDVLADGLARRYANPHTLATAEVLDLSILGVRSASDYARVANYLEGLDTVRDLFVSSVDNERIRVRFSARGGRAALDSSIGFGRVLSRVEGQSDAYQLMP